METKLFDAVELKTGPEGTFEALVCSFNKVDKCGDVFRPGAFVQSIAEWRASGGRVPVIYAHQHDKPEMTIGDVAPEGLQETERGLVAAGHFYLDEPNARKVFTQLQRKTLRDWSFAFLIQQSKPLASGSREMLRVHLREIGPCLIGAGQTETLAVKSEPPVGDVATARGDLARVLLVPYRVQLDRLRRRTQLARLR